MTKPQMAKTERSALVLDGGLSDEQLEGVSGGNSISILTTLPNYRGPKLGVGSGSIAHGDTLDNTLTENGLP